VCVCVCVIVLFIDADAPMVLHISDAQLSRHMGTLSHAVAHP